MSNALAIAGVTAVIRDLLDNGLIDHQVVDAMGRGVTVSTTAPDNIELTGAAATPRLNLFLYQLTPNSAWRNVGFPSHDSRGNSISNPPLALDLYYLLTAYGNEDLQTEVLLGYAMQLLHETPVLPRDAIRKALNPSPVNGNILPTIFQALRTADLAEQVELIKITPASLNTEEMSNLWSALQAHYRPTAAYHVSVVLIESRRPARSPLPVLTRGRVDQVTNRESGVVVEPNLVPAVPMIESVELPDKQVIAQLKNTIKLTGHHLSGTSRSVLLMNDRFKIEQEVPALAGDSDAMIEFNLLTTLVNAQKVLPVGFYSVSAKMLRPAKPGQSIETEPRTTNQLPLVIAPEITSALPQNFQSIADGSVTIKLDCQPEVRPEQPVSLLLGEQEINSETLTVASSSLVFQVPAPIAKPIVGKPQLVRLRVDGIESPIIDRSPMPDKPPVFFNHRITIT